MTSTNRIFLLSILALTMGMPGLARAADVDLHGGSAFVNGLSKLKVKDLGTCSYPASLDVTFKLLKDKFIGVDAEDRTFKGKYKQSGIEGRTIAVTLSSKSKNKLANAVKALVQYCFDTNNVSVNLSNIVFKAKVLDTVDTFDTIKVKGKAHVEGKVDGDSGSATYILSLIGPLNLAPPPM